MRGHVRGHSVLRSRELEDRTISPQRARRYAEDKQVIYILHASWSFSAYLRALCGELIF
jgi:hypothetical protein